MTEEQNEERQPEEPEAILGVAANAGDEEIRAAYLRKVREFPPDRAPDDFERVRDAYEVLRNPRKRLQRMLLAADPTAPFTALLDEQKVERRFVGPQPWLQFLKETE